MKSRVPVLLLVTALVWPSVAVGQDTLTFADEAPDDGLDHFFVPFDVPAGTVEIAITHDDLSEANILDWGLLDDTGAFRGWGGGNAEPIVVGVDAASRSYLTGPIQAGTWRVVVGKAKIAEPPGEYTIEVKLRATPTLTAQPERSPYVATPALEVGPRWYAGDLHVHSLESGDARPTIDDVATFARARGLDFVHLSEHNTVSQHDFLVDAQSRHPALLLIPGMEWTTYSGHAGTIGLTDWADHKVGMPGVTAVAAANAVHEQGALFNIHHPVLDLGDMCIGCAWTLEVPPEAIDGVEVAGGGWEQSGYIFTRDAIAWWDALCDRGAHAAALGGSDDHKGGRDLGLFDSPIGNPTTMVYADELSVESIIRGIRDGRTVVKLQGPSDPMIELESDPPREGDTISAQYVVLRATVEGAAAGTTQVRFVKNGQPLDAVGIDGDPFVFEQEFDAPATGEDRYRVEVVTGSNRPLSLTSHLWVRYGDDLPSRPRGGDPGPEPADDVGDPPDDAGTDAAVPPPADVVTDGCGCEMVAYRTPSGAWPLLSTLAAALLRLSLRSRRRTG
jgi:hypothetical protein